MQKEEDRIKKDVSSESEEDLDDTQTVEEKQEEKSQKAGSAEMRKKVDLDFQKMKELRKQFRDKPFLVKGEESHFGW